MNLSNFTIFKYLFLDIFKPFVVISLVFPGNTIEWWFVPIKTGEFNDLYCGIKDKKTGVFHSEMGMMGTIIIE